MIICHNFHSKAYIRLPFEVLVYCVSYRVVTVGWSCAPADWVVSECLCEPPAENSCCADWRCICSFVSSGTFLMIVGIVVVILCVYVCMHPYILGVQPNLKTTLVVRPLFPSPRNSYTLLLFYSPTLELCSTNSLLRLL